MNKKLLSIILVVAYLLTMFSVSVFASGKISLDPIGEKNPGDIVAIWGTTSFDRVSIKIIRPDNMLFDIDSVAVVSGRFHYEVAMPEEPTALPTGTYTVVVGQGEEVATTTFSFGESKTEDPEDPEDPPPSGGGPIIIPPVDDGDEDEEETHPSDGIEINDSDINQALKKLTDAQTAQQKEEAIDDLADLLSTIADNLAKITQAEGAKKLAGQAVKVLIDIDKFMVSQSAEDALSFGNKIIEQAARVIKSSESAGSETRKVMKSTAKLADTVITTVGKVLAAQEGPDQQEILGRAKAATSAVGKLNSNLAKSGITLNIENKVTLEVQDDEGIALTGSLISSLMQEGIEKVELLIGSASMTVPLDFSSSVEGSETVELKLKKIQVTDELRNEMSQEQVDILGTASHMYEVEILIDGQKVTEFEKGISVKIPYALKANEIAANMTAIHFTDEGTALNRAGRYDEIDKRVQFSAKQSGKYITKNIVRKFKDIRDEYWGRPAIEAMASKGVLAGRPDGNFYPNDNVTRAEFAKMLSEAMGIVNEGAVADFSDISTSAWYYVYVASAASKGIIQGNEGKFMPNNNISRQEMAVMIARALGESAPASIDKFLDFNDRSSIAGYAEEAIALAVRYEILTGRPGKLMDPRGNASRAEAAAVIARYFDMKLD